MLYQIKWREILHNMGKLRKKRFRNDLPFSKTKRIWLLIIKELCTAILRHLVLVKSYQPNVFAVVANGRKVNNRETGWSIAHLVNNFAHPGR